MKRLAIPAAAILLLASSAALDLRIAEGALSKPYDVKYVPTGPAARIAALGHRTFLSDLYWLSAVQYIGETKADQRGWDKLLPLVDLVTDLDPRHGYAYQTAGIVLSAAGRLDESDRILQKGIDRGPPYWTFPYYVSFNHWFYRGDYEKGAEYARLAAKVPGASPNISHLAVSLAAKSGTPDDALRLLEELRATVQDEVTASRLDEQMKLATLERDAQALERAAERFRAQSGRDPLSLHELVWTGHVRELPKDPFGGVYRWDPVERKVRSTANAFRFSPREGPQGGGFVPAPPPQLDVRRKSE
jgi:tetratricopeptide (TPR) repeat protein